MLSTISIQLTSNLRSMTILNSHVGQCSDLRMFARSSFLLRDPGRVGRRRVTRGHCLETEQKVKISSNFAVSPGQ